MMPDTAGAAQQAAPFIPVPPAATPAAKAAEPVRARPSAIRALLGHHGGALAPWILIAGDIPFTLAAHALPGTEAKAIAAAAITAAAGTAGGVHVARGKRSRRVCRAMATVAAAGAGETSAAIFAGPLAGPHHALLIALLAGGTGAAWRWRHVAGRPEPRPTPAEPRAITVREEPRDAQLVKFLGRFVNDPATGPFRRAAVEFEHLRGGFRLTVWFDPDSDATASMVTSTTQGGAYTASIAKLYGIATEQVTIEHLPGTRAEGVAVITVITEQSLVTTAQRWNGASTYNAKAGTFISGRYNDGAPGHWRLHTPQSGAAGGLFIGKTGHGKTGAMLTLAGEASLAHMCRKCLAEGSCRRCDMARISGVWLADPQMLPFSVLRGKADLTAWGPKATVLMLLWAQAILKYRASVLAEVERTDPHGRGTYKGRGWFDPEPRFPLLQVIVDEIPLIVKDPALAKLAIPAMSDITQAGRKVGMGLNPASPLPDQPYIGDRMTVEQLQAFNVAAFKSDPTSMAMLGIKGDPSRLPMNVRGLCLLGGYDDRSSSIHRWKYAPELRNVGDSGIDMHDIAALMAEEYIEFGDDVMGAVGPLGYRGGGQVVTDDDFDKAMARRDKQAATPAAPPVPAPPAAMVAQAADLAVPVSRSRLAAARRALDSAAAANGGTAEVFDVMEALGTSLAEAEGLTGALVAAGQATSAGNGFFTMQGGA